MKFFLAQAVPTAVGATNGVPKKLPTLAAADLKGPVRTVYYVGRK